MGGILPCRFLASGALALGVSRAHGVGWSWTYAAIRYLGIPNYCATPAYCFLVPSYGVLWLGGHWLRRNLTLDARGAFVALASLMVSVSICFLISNGSYYWLGGRVEPTWNGWTWNFATWYWAFVKVPLVYVSVVAVLYFIGTQFRRAVSNEVPR